MSNTGLNVTIATMQALSRVLVPKDGIVADQTQPPFASFITLTLDLVSYILSQWTLNT